MYVHTPQIQQWLKTSFSNTALFFHQSFLDSRPGQKSLMYGTGFPCVLQVPSFKDILTLAPKCRVVLCQGKEEMSVRHICRDKVKMGIPENGT
jgi:hypothetical protein